MGGFAVAMLIFFIYLFPSMLPVATFATYIGVGNHLEYPVAVAALVLFGLMRGPLISAPMFFGDLIQLMVSMKRIDKFLNSDEVQTNIKDQQDQDALMGPSETCLSVHGSFSWGFTSNKKKDDKKSDSTTTPSKKQAKKLLQIETTDSATTDEKADKKKLSKFITLKDIKMEVKKGEFVCIIGDVGSGKSSLLQTIIGDLIYMPQGEIDQFGGMDHEGTQEEYDLLKTRLFGEDLQVNEKPIKIKGSVAYVEQVSWIQNKTIQDNIIFGKPFNAKRYALTIKSC